jgi:RNA polymerase sigma factor (sigma-70 family)
MNWILTGESLGKLLDCFDADHNRAGEKYEDLRRALIRFFEGRGIFFSEECADEVFNRVARRLVEGVEIRNLNAYCYEVARLVLLERIKSRENKRAPLEENLSDESAIDSGEDLEEKERRLKCLDTCLEQLPPESRALIIEYYQDDRRNRINRRRSMAERLGVRRDALANRVQRLRSKLEQCIMDCLKKEAV